MKTGKTAQIILVTGMIAFILACVVPAIYTVMFPSMVTIAMNTAFVGIVAGTSLMVVGTVLACINSFV